MAKKVGRITLDKEACKACYLCVSVCPEKLIAVSEKLNQMGTKMIVNALAVPHVPLSALTLQ
jgi:ferredoxin